jgi:hypothetical protein
MDGRTWRYTVFQTDNATFVHIAEDTFGARQESHQQRAVKGKILDAFNAHKSVLVSNNKQTESDKAIQAFLTNVTDDESDFNALPHEQQSQQYNAGTVKLASRVAKCLLIPLEAETFKKNDDATAKKFVTDQYVVNATDNPIVTQHNNALLAIQNCALSKQYVSLKYYAHNFPVIHLGPYFVDAFYALYCMHNKLGLAHGWIRPYSVCISTLDPTNSRETENRAGLARFEHAYRLDSGPDNMDALLKDGPLDDPKSQHSKSCVNPAIKKLIDAESDIYKKKNLFKEYAVQLDLYALFVVLFDLLDNKWEKSDGLTHETFKQWVEVCTATKSTQDSSLTGIAKILSGVTFKPAAACCMPLVITFGLATPKEAQRWMIARYKTGPPKGAKPPKVEFGRTPFRLPTGTLPKRREVDPSVSDSATSDGNEQEEVHYHDEEVHHHDEGQPKLVVDSDLLKCYTWESKTAINIKSAVLTGGALNDRVFDTDQLASENVLTTQDLTNLTESPSFGCFKPGGFISNVFMNRFLALIPREAHVFITLTATDVTGNNKRIVQPEHRRPKSQHTLVYIPFRINKNHWVYVCVDRSKPATVTLTVFNSLSSRGETTAKYTPSLKSALVEFGLDERLADSLVVSEETPRQSEFECAVYVCFGIWYACTGRKLNTPLVTLGQHNESARLFMLRCISENYLPYVVAKVDGNDVIYVYPNQYLLSTTKDQWEARRRAWKYSKNKADFLIHYIQQPPSEQFCLSAQTAQTFEVDETNWCGVSNALLPLCNSTYMLFGYSQNLTNLEVRCAGRAKILEDIKDILEKLRKIKCGYDDFTKLFNMVGVRVTNAFTYTQYTQLPCFFRLFKDPKDADESFRNSMDSLDSLLPKVAPEADDDDPAASVRALSHYKNCSFAMSCDDVQKLVEKALGGDVAEAYTRNVVEQLQTQRLHYLGMFDQDSLLIHANDVVNSALSQANERLELKNLKLHHTSPDGNCFYECVLTALGSPIDIPDTTKLRENIYNFFIRNFVLTPDLLEGINDIHIDMFNTRHTNNITRDNLTSKDHEYFKWYFCTNSMYADQFGMYVAASYANLNFVQASFVTKNSTSNSLISSIFTEGEVYTDTFRVNAASTVIRSASNCMALLFSGESSNGHFDLILPRNSKHRNRPGTIPLVDVSNDDDDDNKQNQDLANVEDLDARISEWLKQDEPRAEWAKLDREQSIINAISLEGKSLKLTNASINKFKEDAKFDSMQAAWQRVFGNSSSFATGISDSLLLAAKKLGMNIKVFDKDGKNVTRTMSSKSHRTPIIVARIHDNGNVRMQQVVIAKNDIHDKEKHVVSAKRGVKNNQHHGNQHGRDIHDLTDSKVETRTDKKVQFQDDVRIVDDLTEVVL